MPIPVNRPQNEQQRPTPARSNEPDGLPDLEEELALPTPPPRPQPRVPAPAPVPVETPERSNLFDEEDDDTFTQISPDDDSLYADEEDWEEEAPAPAPKPSRRPAPKPAPRPIEIFEEEDEVKPKRRFGRKAKEEKPELAPGYTEDTFIDEKTEKLKPFGRKRAAKVSDFDNRKNMRQKAKFIQLGVIGLLLTLIGLGVKNAFFPPESLTPAEVVGIVKNETGSYGFPLDRGAAFSKDFMQAYLDVSQDPTEKAVNDQVLSYYYSGLKAGGAPQRTISFKFNQKILFGPTVYESRELTDHSARYTIGVLVEPSAVGSKPPVDGSAAQWSFFNVNVYYDKALDTFTITPNSPTVVPPINVKPGTELPEGSKIGTGSVDIELTNKLKSVVYGFVNGYTTSSPSDHTALDQYILPDPPPELLKGLEGRYKLAGPPENAIQFEAFPTEDPGVAKVKIAITWRDGQGESTMDYKSSYVMTLNRQSNGTYLVAKFAPEYFSKAPPKS